MPRSSWSSRRPQPPPPATCSLGKVGVGEGRKGARVVGAQPYEKVPSPCPGDLAPNWDGKRGEVFPSIDPLKGRFAKTCPVHVDS